MAATAEKQSSRFKTDFSGMNNVVFNDAWGVPNVNEALQESLRRATRKAEGGLDMLLINGHTLVWQPSLDGKSPEFIGMTERTKKFDATDAKAVVAACKTHGWGSIDVHGTQKQREMMWLEAMRQGLQVGNFEPLPGSAAYRKWQEEQNRKAKPAPLEGTIEPASKALVVSRFSRPKEEDIIDVDFTEVKKPGATPASTFLPKPALALPKPVLALPAPEKGGPRALPPPSGPKGPAPK